jgi:hypothetical protein
MPKKSPVPPLPFPRLMWADFDPSYTRPDARVVLYSTKAEQRANRPDLRPIRVAVIDVTNTCTVAAEDTYRMWCKANKR